MATAKFHLQDQEIPDGLQIFEDRLEVARIAHRKKEAANFAKAKKIWLELESEQENKYDKNAIKIIGCSKGFFGIKRRFIGYVPKDIAKSIVENGLWNQVKPRLLKTYIGESGYVEILFQILGPKGKKYEFKQPKAEGNGHYTEYVDRVKQLKSEKNHEEAIELLLKLVAQIENEARRGGAGRGVAPWYYEQLAILYRKEKRYEDEVKILERYENQPKAPGVGPQKLAERLMKARQLKEKNCA